MNNSQPIPHNIGDHPLHNLLDELLTLRKEVLDKAQSRLDAFSMYYPGRRFNKSAYNLAHYLSLRQHDLRPLQDQLAHIGLSSLGRSEAHVVATLTSVIELLCRVEHLSCDDLSNDSVRPGYKEGHKILSGNIKKMFGAVREYRNTRIMVTMPSEAANDSSMVNSMFESGMDCARINCAHDDDEIWKSMIKNIRQAETKTGRQCRILMDLAGHKIRTAPLLKMPGIRHIKVKKDFTHEKQIPTNVILTDEDQIQEIITNTNGSKYILYIPKELHQKLAPGDRLVFNDIRGKSRVLNVMNRVRGDHWLTHCNKSMYLADETPFKWERPDKNNKFIVLGKYSFGGIGETPVEIRLYKDDCLRLTRKLLPGEPAKYDEHGTCISHAHISCTTPEVLDDLKVGDPVWIDDGKLGTIIESITDNYVQLKVTHCGPDGLHLKEDKGINLPDTKISLPALTVKDLHDLDFICQHADMIGFSFVESLADINCLLNELDKRNAQHIAVIAKIETKRAVKNLPEIILGTIGRRLLGIMIARGDLAVELGPERLSEIQEEILWLCEAAHIPVIWATQVLETMVKKGVISRPEFSDAAMGERADCIMLNKGPYILHALHTLNDILVRMQAHQRKKQSLMCALQW